MRRWQGAIVMGQSEGVWGSMEFSLFLEILETVPGCNWSVRAYRPLHEPVCFQLSGLCGPFALLRWPRSGLYSMDLPSPQPQREAFTA